MWKPFQSYEDQATHILEQNKYMIIATCNKDKIPWAAPVFFTYDKEFNFYFLSATDSQHVKNLMENPNVALQVYDSNQPLGFAEQVQILGKALEVEKKDLKKVIELYCERLFPNSDIPPTQRYNPDEYSKPAEFRFFKVAILKTYTTGPDRKTEVDLKKKM